MPVNVKVPMESAGERADKVLARHFTDISRMRLQEAFALDQFC